MAFRVLHLIYDDIANPWIGGGGARRVLETYRRFDRSFEITVCTGSYPGASEQHKDGVRFRRLGLGANLISSGLSYSIGGSKIASSSDADIIVEDFSPFTPILSLSRRGKYIASVQNYFGPQLSKQFGLPGVPISYVEAKMIKRFRTVLVPSGWIAQRVRGTRGWIGRICVIHPGVDDRLFVMEARESDFILYLGRLDIYQKGIDILLKAVRLVKDRGASVRLIIAGRGPKERIEAMVSYLSLAGSVQVLGPVSESLKAKLLSECLFLCAPSRYESWCISACEASAVGKAVIASRVGGLLEVVVDGRTGILVPIGDYRALSSAVLTLLGDPDLRRKLGSAGRNHATNYSWDRAAKLTMDFYRRVLEDDWAHP